VDLYISDSILEKLLLEDIQYVDLTTSALGIGSAEGVARVFFREDGVVACSEEAARIYELAGARVEYFVRSGEWVQANQVVLEARGKSSSLHLAWRVAQTLLSYASGVATYTRRMVEKARRVNPGVVIATTRQTPPGTRPFYIKAVLAGGGIVHRQSLSDSILIFDNHLAFLEERRVSEAVKRALKFGGGRSVGVEVRDLEEAIEAIESGAYYIQFERVQPNILRDWVKKIRELNSRVVIGVGGGITIDNVEEYASTGVDVIVTSAPYRAKPIDVSTRMEKIESSNNS
jgi:molybdenum transport protein